MKDGNIFKGQTGPLPTITNNIQTAPSNLPKLPVGTTLADVQTTIHSHPIQVEQVGICHCPNPLIHPQLVQVQTKLPLDNLIEILLFDHRDNQFQSGNIKSKWEP